MNYIVGLDIGSSTTKAVLFKEGDIVGVLKTGTRSDEASTLNIFEKLIEEHQVSKEEVERVVLTGLWAPTFEKDFSDYTTTVVSELKAIGLGGKYLSGLDRTLVVNMGTGTAFIKVIGDDISHIGGSGVGGGTLLGLSNLLLDNTDLKGFIELLEKGDLSKVDLCIGDICTEPLEGLTMDTTVANFGSLKNDAAPKDIARGLMNMIFQVIGIMAVFAAREDNIEQVVLAGHLATIEPGLFVFRDIERLHRIKFLIPKYAEYTTAIGAAISASTELI